MSRFLFAVLLVLLVGSAHAEPVSLRFRDIRIVPLLDMVIRDILQREYVISSEVAKNDALISMNVKPERDQVLSFLRDTLAMSKVAMIERAGVLYFEPAKSEQVTESQAAPAGRLEPPRAAPIASGEHDASGFEVFSYTPKYRPVELLLQVVRATGLQLPDIKGRLDAVVFTASADKGEKILKLLTEVDQPLRSVFVKAALVEYVDTSESQRGITALLSILKGRFGMQYQAGNSLVNSVTLNAPDIQAVLSALDGDSRFNSIAEPSMRVLDGEMGRLVVGSDVPTRGQTSVSNGTTTTGVDYKTAGVVLQVEPKIQQHSIIMKISQTVSDVQNTTSSGIDSPTMTKREAATTVDLADGEVLLIAGMDQSKSGFTRSGLFFLPSFLQSSNTSKSNSQIMLLLEVRRNKAAAI